DRRWDEQQEQASDDGRRVAHPDQRVEHGREHRPARDADDEWSVDADRTEAPQRDESEHAGEPPQQHEPSNGAGPPEGRPGTPAIGDGVVYVRRRAGEGPYERADVVDAGRRGWPGGVDQRRGGVIGRGGGGG